MSGWSIQSAAIATDPGSAISEPGYGASGWIALSEPQTLMAGLVASGRYPDIFFSNALASVPTAQFQDRWWYRTTLDLAPRPDQHTFLILNGVLSRANLWVNGVKVADASSLQGAYARFEYDITSIARAGANGIALEVFRNDATHNSGYLTLTMVDWNPPSPDGWTGLQFAPEIAQDGPMSLRGVHVVQENAEDMSWSEVTVKADLRNNSEVAQRVEVAGSIRGNGADIAFRKRVSVPARATVPIAIGPQDAASLRIPRPALWWPHDMGDQPLYRLRVVARVGRDPSDVHTSQFGIRTVTSHLTHVTPATFGRSGYRRFVINGRRLLIRGGGWSQDLFLRYSPQNVQDQLSLIKDLGLNAVRFEGNFPPEAMLEAMDRAGILAMPGWQCCAKWEQHSSLWSAGTWANAANQARSVAERMRDHPCVFTFFQGGDEAPDPAKEALFVGAFDAADWRTPQIASGEYKSSPMLGVSGSKEGPYNFVPPLYWWFMGPAMNKGGDFTNAGGPFGFNAEASAGYTIPTQDSLDRFLTPADQDLLWHPDSLAGLGSGPDIFHASPYTTYTGVGRMGQYNTPLWRRYGAWTDMVSYQRAAQAAGYELTRAQFEACIGRSRHPDNPCTGLIYWMMNKAWPSVQWQLYGYDFDQAGAYFGAKKANEPLHVMYAYDDGSVLVSNLGARAQHDLRARAERVDASGAVLSKAEADVRTLRRDEVATVFHREALEGPETSAAGDGPTAHFLRLTLSRRGRIVSRNVYWLSSHPDVLDWESSVGAGFGAVFEPDGYADFAALRSLQPAAVTARASTRRDGPDAVTEVTIENPAAAPALAFLVRVDLRRADATGSETTPLGGDDQVLPIRWSDNLVTLWPGERQTLVARYRHADLRGARAVISITGWNVALQVVPAPLSGR